MIATPCLFRVVAVGLGLGACACAGDAVGEPDAGPDVAPDLFCFTRPALHFCADFDEAALPAPFGTDELVGGALALDDSDATSAPHALVVSLDDNAPGPQAAQLARSFGAGQRFKFFGQLRVDALPNSGDAEVVAIDFAELEHRVGLVVDESGDWHAYQESAGVRTVFEANDTFGLAAWRSFRFDLEFIAAAETTPAHATLKVHFGGDRVIDVDTLAAPAAQASPTLRLGLRGTAPGAAIALDDVTWMNFDTPSAPGEP